MTTRQKLRAQLADCAPVIARTDALPLDHDEALRRASRYESLRALKAVGGPPGGPPQLFPRELFDALDLPFWEQLRQRYEPSTSGDVVDAEHPDRDRR